MALTLYYESYLSSHAAKISIGKALRANTRTEELKKTKKSDEENEFETQGTENTESAKRRESSLKRVESRQDSILARSILLYFLLSTIHFLGASPPLCFKLFDDHHACSASPFALTIQGVQQRTNLLIVTSDFFGAMLASSSFKFSATAPSSNDVASSSNCLFNAS